MMANLLYLVVVRVRMVERSPLRSTMVLEGEELPNSNTPFALRSNALLDFQPYTRKKTVKVAKKSKKTAKVRDEV